MEVVLHCESRQLDYYSFLAGDLLYLNRLLLPFSFLNPSIHVALYKKYLYSIAFSGQLARRLVL